MMMFTKTFKMSFLKNKHFSYKNVFSTKKYQKLMKNTKKFMERLANKNQCTLHHVKLNKVAFSGDLKQT